MGMGFSCNGFWNGTRTGFACVGKIKGDLEPVSGTETELVLLVFNMEGTVFVTAVVGGRVL